MRFLDWFKLPRSTPDSGVSRRGFLGSLLAAPLSTGISPSVPETRLALGRFYVAGFQYHDGPALVRTLGVGQEYSLVPDPSNVHDRFAVRIRFGDAFLGFIPRAENRQIFRLLEQRAHLRCTATRMNQHADPWEMLEVEISLVTPAPSGRA
jgi:hypothetical protein